MATNKTNETITKALKETPLLITEPGLRIVRMGRRDLSQHYQKHRVLRATVRGGPRTMQKTDHKAAIVRPGC